MCSGNGVMLEWRVWSWKHEWKNLEDINHIGMICNILIKIIFGYFEVQHYSIGLPSKGIWRHKKQWYQQSTDSLQSGTGRYWHDSIECCCHSLLQQLLLLVSLLEKRVSFFFVLSELLELANLLGSTRLLKPPTKQPEVFPSCWICTKWEIRCTM